MAATAAPTPTRTSLSSSALGSVEFKLYLIKEFQRLKDEENDRLKLDWNLQRTLAKINYRIHTDAIKNTLIPPAFLLALQSILRHIQTFDPSISHARPPQTIL
jgi:hypothetical protein